MLKTNLVSKGHNPLGQSLSDGIVFSVKRQSCNRYVFFLEMMGSIVLHSKAFFFSENETLQAITLVKSLAQSKDYFQYRRSNRGTYVLELLDSSKTVIALGGGFESEDATLDVILNLAANINKAKTH